MTVFQRLPVEPEALEDFCKRHHITKLALFGSVLRGDYDDSSDVDVLVAFEAGHTPGWEFFALEDELGALLGRKVDLGTFGGLRNHARDDILSSAYVIYDAA